MKTIYTGKLLQIDEIHLTQGIVLENKICMLYDRFLIVGDGDEDINPVWLNVDTIEKMEGVKPIYDQQRKMKIASVI